MFLRDGVVAPVDLPGLHQPQVTRRHAYERTGVAPARLEEHDLAARSAAQTVRQHTACRSAADDHKISHEAFLPLISLPLPPLVKALSSMAQLPTSPQALFSGDQRGRQVWHMRELGKKNSKRWPADYATRSSAPAGASPADWMASRMRASSVSESFISGGRTTARFIRPSSTSASFIRL